MELFLGAFTQDWERRRAAILHEHSIGASRPYEEEWRRRSSGAPVDGGGLAKGRHSRGGAAATQIGFGGVGSGRKRGERPMAKRFQGLAKGSQPAVVKMVSFGGGSRLGAMAAYASRNGSITLEDQSGIQLRGRDQVRSLPAEWRDIMSGRAESRDVGVFRIEMVRGLELDRSRMRQILMSGFGDRAFVFAMSEDHDKIRIDGLVVLRDSLGERLTADVKATGIFQTRFLAAAPDTAIKLTFAGHGNGVEYATRRLRKLVEERSGPVEDNRGRPIVDAKQAGNLVQLEWRQQLHSRKPRDLMHLVMSARAGTDPDKFQDAAREFLGSEFAGHRYVFALHDPASDTKDVAVGGRRPHVHIHAIVAMRSDDGKRLETSISSFRRWREALARQARAVGIAMEMTDRREFATAPAYSRGQVRPVDHAARTEHEGTSDRAQRRYQCKRVEKPTSAASPRSVRYTNNAHLQWTVLSGLGEGNEVRSFADHQINRIEAAAYGDNRMDRIDRQRANYLSSLRTELGMLGKLLEVDDMSAMTRPDFEAYEKRIQTAVTAAERSASGNDRASLDDIVAAVRAHVEARRDMMEVLEAARQVNNERRGNSNGEVGNASDRWDTAVARHGLTAVEAANRAMIAVEHYRDAIERVDAGDIEGNKALLQASLRREIVRTAELGASGNGMIHEITGVDDDLRLALQAAEQRRARDLQKIEDAKETNGDEQPSSMFGPGPAEQRAIRKVSLQERRSGLNRSDTAAAVSERKEQQGKADDNPRSDRGDREHE